MRTKDELFRAAQREIAARRQHAVMQAETCLLYTSDAADD